MTQREELARNYFLSGYNCSQAVAAAFADELGMTEEQALRVSAVLGGGFAATRHVCGAVMAAGLVLSCAMGGEHKERKKDLYDRARALSDSFAQVMGSCVCRDLLAGNVSTTPAERTPEYYKKRPCADCVGLAAKLLEAELLRQNEAL